MSVVLSNPTLDLACAGPLMLAQSEDKELTTLAAAAITNAPSTLVCKLIEMGASPFAPSRFGKPTLFEFLYGPQTANECESIFAVIKRSREMASDWENFDREVLYTCKYIQHPDLEICAYANSIVYKNSFYLAWLAFYSPEDFSEDCQTCIGLDVAKIVQIMVSENGTQNTKALVEKNAHLFSSFFSTEHADLVVREFGSDTWRCILESKISSACKELEELEESGDRSHWACETQIILSSHICWLSLLLQKY